MLRHTALTLLVVVCFRFSTFGDDIDTDPLEALFAAASEQMFAGHYEAGRAGFQELIGRGDRTAAVLSRAGFCELMLGNFKVADRLYREALERDANDQWALRGIGNLAQLRGKLDAAIADYKIVERMAPNDVAESLAWLYWSIGDYATAQKYFQELFERPSGDKDTLREALESIRIFQSGSKEDYEPTTVVAEMLRLNLLGLMRLKAPDPADRDAVEMFIRSIIDTVPTQSMSTPEPFVLPLKRAAINHPDLLRAQLERDLRPLQREVLTKALYGLDEQPRATP